MRGSPSSGTPPPGGRPLPPGESRGGTPRLGSPLEDACLGGALPLTPPLPGPTLHPPEMTYVKGRESTMQEVLYLLVVVNKLLPVELEHLRIEPDPLVDLVGLDGSTSPIQHIAQWRGNSSYVLPRLRGGNKGIPMDWTRFLIRVPFPLTDSEWEQALKAGDYAVTSLGRAPKEALATVQQSIALLGRGVHLPGEQGRKDHADFLREVRGVTPAPVRGRIRIPALQDPPKVASGRGRPVVGTREEDRGLICYLPGFIQWLRERSVEPGPAVFPVRQIIEALPSKVYMPTPEELEDAVRRRLGKVKARSLRSSWPAFQDYFLGAQSPTGVHTLPDTPLKRIPDWEAPQEVVRSVKRILGTTRGNYASLRGVSHAEFLTRIQRDYGEEARIIQHWSKIIPEHVDTFPAIPAKPGSKKPVNPTVLWQKARFSLPDGTDA